MRATSIARPVTRPVTQPLATAVVAASLVAIAACKPKVDTKGVEDFVRKRTAEIGVAATKVTCPADVEAKPGQVFACQVELEGKKTYGLDVTVKSVDTSTSTLSFDTAWHDGAAVVVSKVDAVLGGELSKALGGAVVAKCGNEPLRMLDAKHQIQCELTAGEVKTTATVDFDAALNATNWHLDPPLLAKAKLEGVLTPAVREKTNPDVTVDCGAAAFLLRPASGKVICAAVAGADRARLEVEVDDKLNVTRWEIPPAAK
jgi:hypothetical protein